MRGAWRGRTIGILGYGAVGRLVAQRARAFDMRIVAWLPRTTLEPRSEPGLEFCNWPRELARLSDIVTVHDIEDGTDPLVDAEFLRNMREGSYLVHVGDRHAVDEAALADALEQRKLRVALDVFASAPSGDVGRFRCKLCDRAEVIGTQQIGPLTEQARDAIATEVVRIVHAFVVFGRGAELPEPVRTESGDVATRAAGAGSGGRHGRGSGSRACRRDQRRGNHEPRIHRGEGGLVYDCPE